MSFYLLNALVQFLLLLYERLSQPADIIHLCFRVGETLLKLALDV